jgi:DNA-3-methyladenine glycosylase II
MSLARAVTHLKRADPTLGRLIRRVGPCTLEPRREGTHFDAVLRAIVYQQLSGKAAGTILRRVHALYGDRSPTPAELLATPEETLRAAGLSRQKQSYARDLAAKVAEGTVPVDALDAMSDDEILAALTSVKGVGRWTAQMFLMFRLGRLDVLPDLDLGVQKGIQLAYGLERLPKPKQVLEIGAPWAPYRSVAAWYFWRSLDNGDGQAAAPP